MEVFVGKWKLTNSDNFDEYMKALGVGMATRMLANKTSPTLEFIVDSDGCVTFKTMSTVKSSEIKFKLGQEFEENTMDGRKVKTTITLENGKLVQRQMATKAGDKNTELTREINGNDMKVTMPLEGIVCTRTYTRC